MKKGQLEIIWPGDGEHKKEPKLHNAKERIVEYRVEFICPETYNIYDVTQV